MDAVKSVKVKFSVSEVARGLKKLYPDNPLVQSMPEGDDRGVPALECFGDQFGVTLVWEQVVDVDGNLIAPGEPPPLPLLGPSSGG